MPDSSKVEQDWFCKLAEDGPLLKVTVIYASTNVTGFRRFTTETETEIIPEYHHPSNIIWLEQYDPNEA